MRVHSKEKIQEIKRLRRKGFSIIELVSRLGIPKTTIWHHIHSIKLLPQYKARLNSKRGGSTKRKEFRIARAYEKAKILINSSNREFLIALAMLYWSEGSKNSCVFTNSDGKMIKLYLSILEKILGIQKHEIKLTLRIFSGMHEGECLNYWSKILDISKKNFTVYLNDGGISGKTKYGMCRVNIKKSGNLLKLIRALIDLSLDDILKKLNEF